MATKLNRVLQTKEATSKTLRARASMRPNCSFPIDSWRWQSFVLNNSKLTANHIKFLLIMLLKVVASCKFKFQHHITICSLISTMFNEIFKFRRYWNKWLESSYPESQIELEQPKFKNPSIITKNPIILE